MTGNETSRDLEAIFEGHIGAWSINNAEAFVQGVYDGRQKTLHSPKGSLSALEYFTGYFVGLQRIRTDTSARVKTRACDFARGCYDAWHAIPPTGANETYRKGYAQIEATDLTGAGLYGTLPKVKGTVRTSARPLGKSRSAEKSRYRWWVRKSGNGSR